MKATHIAILGKLSVSRNMMVLLRWLPNSRVTWLRGSPEDAFDIGHDGVMPLPAAINR